LGLNLAAASRVVLFEPGWNPTNNIQALSRVRAPSCSLLVSY
jgi:SNF2 family DNA or RNA helicase